MDLTHAGSVCSVEVVAHSAGYHANIYGNNCGTTGLNDHAIPNSPPFGEWDPLMVDVVLGPTPTLTVTIGGGGGIFETAFTPIGVDAVAIHLGPAASSPLQVRYDNAVLKVR
jgi:hypothetical protein